MTKQEAVWQYQGGHDGCETLPIVYPLVLITKEGK